MRRTGRLQRNWVGQCPVSSQHTQSGAGVQRAVGELELTVQFMCREQTFSARIQLTEWRRPDWLAEVSK